MWLCLENPFIFLVKIFFTFLLSHPGGMREREREKKARQLTRQTGCRHVRDGQQTGQGKGCRPSCGSFKAQDGPSEWIDLPICSL